MEKKNPNIYQRALDIVNHRIDPDIPQGGGGGGSAPEVENAIETGGLGWQTTEVVDDGIRWDGNTTGLYNLLGAFYLVSTATPSRDELIGQTIEASTGTPGTIVATLGPITEDMIEDVDPSVSNINDSVLVCWDDTFVDGIGEIKKGMYFMTMSGVYVSRLTGVYETEVVHVINKKYIPKDLGYLTAEHLDIVLHRTESFGLRYRIVSGDFRTMFEAGLTKSKIPIVTVRDEDNEDGIIGDSRANWVIADAIECWSDYPRPDGTHYNYQVIILTLYSHAFGEVKIVLTNPEEQSEPLISEGAEYYEFWIVGPEKSLTIASSTPGSTKQFKITVNDSGEITATEVT